MKKITITIMLALASIVANAQCIIQGASLIESNGQYSIGYHYGIEYGLIQFTHTTTIKYVLSKKKGHDKHSLLTVGVKVKTVGDWYIVPAIGYYTTTGEWVYEVTPCLKYGYDGKRIGIYIGASTREHGMLAIVFKI